jgi:hypothetical protein
MAGDLMAVGYLQECWLGLGTLRHGKGTAGMEVAAWWWIEGAGHFASEDHLLCLDPAPPAALQETTDGKVFLQISHF